MWSRQGLAMAPLSHPRRLASPRRRLCVPVAAFVLALTLLVAGQATAAGPYTWTNLNVDAAQPITAISCPSSTLCVAGDAAGNVVTSADPAGGAGTWTVSTISSSGINAISCPTTTLCIAVDDAGDSYFSNDPNGGAGTWTSTTINAGLPVNAISCPSISLCVAGGNGGNAIWSTDPTGGLSSWNPVNVDGTNALFSISCPSPALCVAGDDVGNVIHTTTPTGTAGAWTVDHVDGTNVVRAMSCPSVTLCVAGDDGGNAVHSTNPTGGVGTWTVDNLLGFAFIYGMACPSLSLCTAVDSGGSAESSLTPTAGPGSWTGTTINGSSVWAVSCPTTAFCAAAGSGGNVIIGIQGAVTVSLAGTGTGTVTGSGIACPGTCSQSYPGGTAVVLTAAAGADGSTFDGWSGACTGTGACNLSIDSDRAVTATFTAPSPPPPPVPPAATSAAVAQSPAALPAPVVAQNANVSPTSGDVLVRARDSATFVPLTKPEQVAIGSIVDTRRGAVQIVVANGHGGFDTAVFSEGVFKLLQTAGPRALAQLVLFGGNFKGCPKAAKGGAAAARAKRGKSVRHLWGSGSGAFQTKGRFATATIRGTTWLTDDRCNGTLTRVTAGAVTVRDLVKRRSLVVRTPRSYFAQA